MKKLLTLLALFCIAPTVALAQFGAYAGFTSAQLNLPNTHRTDGGTFGAFYDASDFPLINAGADVRGTIADSDNITKIKSITFGPRAVVDLPKFPLRPYAEFLVGEAHVQAGQGVAYSNHNALDIGFAAGADLKIVRGISWRVLDFSYSRVHVTAGTGLTTLTTGIVVRIPFS